MVLQNPLNKIAELLHDADVSGPILYIEFPHDVPHLVFFNYAAYNAISELLRIRLHSEPLVVAEIGRVRDLKIPDFVLAESNPVYSDSKFVLLAPNREHYFIVLCTLSRCEELQNFAEMVGSINIDKVIDDSIRWTEIAFRDKSKYIPAFEIWIVLEEARRRSLLNVDSNSLGRLREVAVEYLIQLIEAGGL